MATTVWEPFPTVAINKFFEELRFEFKDLPPQLFQYYVLQTAVDMAEKANLIRRWCKIELEPCVTRYQLRSPDGMRIWAIMGVFRSEGPDDCAVRNARRSYGPAENARCLPENVAWYDPYDGVLRYTGACECGNLYVNVSVVPERAACELPQIYYERFYSALLTGVRARIMLITGRPWTNMRVGASLMQEYERMLSQDAVRVAERRQRGMIKIQFGKVM